VLDNGSVVSIVADGDGGDTALVVAFRSDERPGSGELDAQGLTWIGS